RAWVGSRPTDRGLGAGSLALPSCAPVAIGVAASPSGARLIREGPVRPVCFPAAIRNSPGHVTIGIRTERPFAGAMSPRGRSTQFRSRVTGVSIGEAGSDIPFLLCLSLSQEPECEDLVPECVRHVQ